MLSILYGSQTGTAECIAERIARECRARLVPVCVNALDDVDITQHNFVVFVCSTTGDGQEPENMKKFWLFLRQRSLQGDFLKNMEFTLFGLGDSSYQKYNFPSRRLYRRLLQLGAKEFYPRGEGDDQHAYGYYKINLE